jgi:hypothetical protein
MINPLWKIQFGIKPFLELNQDEQQLLDKQLLAKEEINLVLYIYKKTFNLADPNYLKMLRKENFWKGFRNEKLCRRANEFTANQFYQIYYRRVMATKLSSKMLLCIYETITLN